MHAYIFGLFLFIVFLCCRLVAAHIHQCILEGVWVVVAVIWVVADQDLIIEVSRLITSWDCICGVNQDASNISVYF